MTAPSPENQMCIALARGGVADWLGMCLIVDSSDREELASTDAVATETAELQFSLWEGPLPRAIDTSVPVLVEDVRQERVRWPLLAERGMDSPVRGVAAFPLQVDGVMGVFAAYWGDPHVCGADEVVELASYARAIAAVATRRLKEPPYADEWNSPISPAVGMVMAHSDLMPDDALAMLRSRAFSLDTTVSDLARRLMAGELSVTEIL